MGGGKSTIKATRKIQSVPYAKRKKEVDNVKLENRFYKVGESGFSLTIATFFNPITKESFSQRVWDIDDDRLLYDDEVQELRDMPINETVKRAYLHHNGRILTGDTVKVIKGRKMPIGYVGTVENIKPYYDKYHRWQANYIYFADGQRTNINNCMLIAIKE